LLECARKLNRVCVRPRAHAELERFRAVIQGHGANGDAVVQNQVVTLLRRNRAADRVMLDALGFGGYWKALDDSGQDPLSEATLSSPRGALA
jgi:hypothetical protein